MDFAGLGIEYQLKSWDGFEQRLSLEDMYSMSMRMPFYLLACIVFVSAIATPAQADSILYTFSTTSGVTGSFTFQESTPFNVEIGSVSTSHFPESQFPTPYVGARSDLSPISGSFGAYAFGGTADIWRQDYRSPYDSALDMGLQDYWILHANVSSQMVLGRSLTFLGLYDYVAPQTEMGRLLAPPPGNTGDPFSFQYIAQFSDGTQASGGLESLTLVPEPSTFLLLGLAVTGVFAMKFRRTRRTNSETQS